MGCVFIIFTYNQGYGAGLERFEAASGIFQPVDILTGGIIDHRVVIEYPTGVVR